MRKVVDLPSRSIPIDSSSSTSVSVSKEKVLEKPSEFSKVKESSFAGRPEKVNDAVATEEVTDSNIVCRS